MENRRGRPVVGLIGGLLFGVGAALMIQQAGLWPLDAVLVYGLPLIGLVIGLLLALWAPFGGRR